MNQIKVLIVDKNILVRQAIACILRKYSLFKIYGIYGDQDQVRKSVQTIDPDVVLLDIETSDNLELLNKLKARFPNLSVILLSPRTPESARSGLSALRMGAIDFITKPRFNKSLLFASRHLNKRLIPILKTAFNLKNRSKFNAGKKNPNTHDQLSFHRLDSFSDSSSKNSKPKVIVIGACTGGPEALFALITGLPDDFPIPIVVVQHFPKYYTAELADKLDKESAISVEEAYEGAELSSGKVWIASGGYHCEISRWNCKSFLKVHRGPRELGVRPSINNLFRSASSTFGRDVIAAVLSGRGEDGLDGVKAVKRAGGTIFVQHPESAIVPELPFKVLQTGLADYCYSIEEMTDQIISLSQITPPQLDKQSNLKTFKGDVKMGRTTTKNLSFY